MCRWACIIIIGPMISSSTWLHCRWACPRPAMSSFGSLCHCQACSIVVGLMVSLFGSLFHRWACTIIVGLLASSLGSCCRRRACHIVIWLPVSSLGLQHRRWASGIVVWLVSSLLSLPRRRSARCVVVGFVLSLLGLPHHHLAYLVGLPLLGPPLHFFRPSAAIYNLLRAAHILDDGRGCTTWPCRICTLKEVKTPIKWNMRTKNHLHTSLND